MTDTLFQENDLSPDISIDPEKNYLEELVGEGKKFQTPEELARGKAEADATIDFFKNQMDRLRDDYLKEREQNTSRAGLEEILNEIKQLKSASNTNDNTSGANETDDKKEPAFDWTKVDEIVSHRLTEAEKAKQKQANLKIVQDKLRERFGSEYQKALREQTRRLGLSEEVANQLAETSPQAFLKALDVESRDGDNIAPPRNQENRINFNQSSGKIKPGTWSYYEEIRKKEPKLYWSPKVQTQMLKDSQRLGEAFDE